MSDLIFVFGMSILGVVLLKVQKKLMPKAYFFYARLIDGIDENISLLGAFVRTLIPFITGIVAGILAIKFQFGMSGETYGTLTGFFSMFLLVWPDFLNPELVSPTYKNKKSKLYLLYFIVLLTFASVGSFGGRVAESVLLGNASLLSWIDPKAIGNGLLAAGVWFILVYFIKRVANSYIVKP